MHGESYRQMRQLGVRLPYLWNDAAYAAVTSIAAIGLHIAYVTPTFLRLRQGSSFQRGPWSLGRWSYLAAIERELSS
jgi:hypothetical protein